MKLLAKTDPIVAPFIAFITDLSFAVGNLAKVSQFLRYAMHCIYILESQSEPLSEPIWLIDRAVALPRFIFPKKCLFILTRSACISDCRGKSNKKSTAYFRKHSCDLPLFWVVFIVHTSTAVGHCLSDLSAICLWQLLPRLEVGVDSTTDD